MNRSFVAALVVLIIAGGIIGFVRNSGGPVIDTESYQAVMLSNGVAYYGKIENMNRKYITLNDVHYLQQGGGNPLTLVKFVNETQGPQNTIYVNKSQVSFVYNLDTTKELYKKIQQLKAQDAKTQPAAVPGDTK
ncbi:MAG: hypothetical protein AAB551_02740 [Patescibacteria group bacterium]